MSINNINNNVKNIPNVQKNENFSKLLNKSLEDLEHRTNTLKIKEIKIKENIRSIKLKEKKYTKITEEITTRKEELKLIKQLLSFKEQKTMNPEDIISSYLEFIISSNNNLDDKLTSLMEKEININTKQRFINKLLGKEIIDDNYDLSFNENIQKPTDYGKFILKPKKQKVIDNGGDDLDNIFINRINNNNLFSVKRNNISKNSSFEKLENGIKTKEHKKNKVKNIYNVNKYINKDLTKLQNYAQNTVNISRLISNNNSNNITERDYNKNNNINILTEKEENKYIYSITDNNDFQKYNLNPNKKIMKARKDFKKILNKMNKSDSDDFKDYILNVLNTPYFLRKILYICYESTEYYNINQQKNVETIHDSDFISKLIENYEDIGEKSDLRELNNIKVFEEGLEEIKKITLETKNLENSITKFAHKIHIYE